MSGRGSRRSTRDVRRLAGNGALICLALLAAQGAQAQGAGETPTRIEIPVLPAPDNGLAPGVTIGTDTPPPATGRSPAAAPAPAPRTAAAQPDPAFAAFQRGKFRTALDLAVKRAKEEDDPVAMVLAGEILSMGYGVRQDAAAARAWFDAAAAKGNADALFAVGALLMKSDSAQQRDQGVELFRRAADKGNSAAAYNLGLIYLQGQVAPKEPALAAQWFSKAADADQPDALYALAVLYRDGNGVPRNPVETARLLRRASELGNHVATTELAIMIFNGTGVPKDEAVAAGLFRDAALGGNAIAQNRYARLLSAGRGVAEDKISAAAWHIAAKAQKLDDPTLDKMTEELSPEQRADAERRAKDWADTWSAPAPATTPAPAPAP